MEEIQKIKQIFLHKLDTETLLHEKTLVDCLKKIVFKKSKDKQQKPKPLSSPKPRQQFNEFICATPYKPRRSYSRCSKSRTTATKSILNNTKKYLKLTGASYTKVNINNNTTINSCSTLRTTKKKSTLLHNEKHETDSVLKLEELKPEVSKLVHKSESQVSKEKSEMLLASSKSTYFLLNAIKNLEESIATKTEEEPMAAIIKRDLIRLDSRIKNIVRMVCEEQQRKLKQRTEINGN